MSKKIKLTPSLMTSKLLNVEEELIELEKAGINWIHFDLMDGKYVNNLGLCPDLLEQIKAKYSNFTIDAHCMVNQIEEIYDRLKLADYITVHLGSEQNGGIDNTIKFLKKNNKKIGIGINLDDDINELKKYIKDIDLITIMSIVPGFAGQKFNEKAWRNIKQINDIRNKCNKNVLLQIDGGVRWDNIEKIIGTGIDLVVLGNMIFSSKNYKEVSDRILGI